MKYCRTCGRSMNDTDRFCPVCGKAVEETTGGHAPYASPVPPTPPAPAPYYPGPNKLGIRTQIDETNPGYKYMEIPVSGLEVMNIKCNVFNISIVEGESDSLVIRWINNRFRSLNIQNTGRSVNLEDRVAVALYGLFRSIKLITDNTLEIQIPTNYKGLHITAKMNANQIEIDDISLHSMNLYSNSGAILIRNVSVEKKLIAHSVSQNVLCQLPGTERDYDVDCRSERRDIEQPVFHSNPDAPRKISLRSGVYVPELIFTGGTIR